MNYLTELYQRNTLAFWISLIYVGLGTLSVCSLYPSDFFFGDWTLWGVLITLPVNIISSGYRYGQAEPIYPVFIIQTVVFVLTFWFLKSRLAKKRKWWRSYCTQQCI